MTTHHALKIVPIATSPLSAGDGRIPELGDFDINALVTGAKIGHHIAYPVYGESCLPYIPPGCYAITDRNKAPVNGNVVAVRLNDSVHIKIFEKRERHLHLISPNEDFKPIEVMPHDDFEVLGVVEWAVVPVTAPPNGNLFRFTGMQTCNGKIRATVTDTFGRVIEMDYTPEEVLKGISLAAKELTRKVLNFVG